MWVSKGQSIDLLEADGIWYSGKIIARVIMQDSGEDRVGLQFPGYDPYYQKLTPQLIENMRMANEGRGLERRLTTKKLDILKKVQKGHTVTHEITDTSYEVIYNDPINYKMKLKFGKFIEIKNYEYLMVKEEKEMVKRKKQQNKTQQTKKTKSIATNSVSSEQNIATAQKSSVEADNTMSSKTKDSTTSSPSAKKSQAKASTTIQVAPSAKKSAAKATMGAKAGAKVSSVAPGSSDAVVFPCNVNISNKVLEDKITEVHNEVISVRDDVQEFKAELIAFKIEIKNEISSEFMSLKTEVTKLFDKFKDTLIPRLSTSFDADAFLNSSISLSNIATESGAGDGRQVSGGSHGAGLAGTRGTDADSGKASKSNAGENVSEAGFDSNHVEEPLTKGYYTTLLSSTITSSNSSIMSSSTDLTSVSNAGLGCGIAQQNTMMPPPSTSNVGNVTYNASNTPVTSASSSTNTFDAGLTSPTSLTSLSNTGLGSGNVQQQTMMPPPSTSNAGHNPINTPLSYATSYNPWQQSSLMTGLQQQQHDFTSSTLTTDILSPYHNHWQGASLGYSTVKRPSFAWYVAQKIFSWEEMLGRNCSGKSNKVEGSRKLLDPTKLLAVNSIVFHFFPSARHESLIHVWKLCQENINSNIRSRENNRRKKLAAAAQLQANTS